MKCVEDWNPGSPPADAGKLYAAILKAGADHFNRPVIVSRLPGGDLEATGQPEHIRDEDVERWADLPDWMSDRTAYKPGPPPESSHGRLCLVILRDERAFTDRPGRPVIVSRWPAILRTTGARPECAQYADAACWAELPSWMHNVDPAVAGAFFVGG